ncbi:MAG: hypothetical protein FH753_14675 [Firmicutes bacterium]|nr:hypothetical protein [Bacillota bacterium]
MSNTMIPVFTKIVFDTPTVDLIPLETEMDIIEGLKKSFKFENIKINNKTVVCEKGFPILKVKIEKNRLEIILVSIEKYSIEDSVESFLDKISILDNKDKIINSIEIANVVRFENQMQMKKFYLGCDNIDGNIEKIDFNLEINHNSEKIKFKFLKTEEEGDDLFTISINESSKFVENNDGIEKLKKIIMLLNEKCIDFLSSRQVEINLKKGIDFNA